MPKIAMCVCGQPLVATLAFSKKEFVCADCLRTYTFFGPDPADETPELIAKCEEQRTKWETLSEGWIPTGAFYRDCPVCRKYSEPHLRHADDDELAAHRAAQRRIEHAGGVIA